MIAADTSAILHFLHGFDSLSKVAVRVALSTERLVLAPVVVTELLSGTDPEPELEAILAIATQIELKTGYWERSGLSRRRLLAKGLRARLSDTLVAQASIDAGLPLIAGDTDFRHFVTYCGLKLAD